MYLANSISQSEIELHTINQLLEQNLNYDWIAYSTSIGLDYLLQIFIDANKEPLLIKKSLILK